jgi:16S rRNA (uracil1498-N3)-methyltransferase
MKQSVKAFIPQLHPLTKVSDFVKHPHSGGKYIAHCYDMPKEALKDVATLAASSTVMIGPEGDFSEEEVAFAAENGFTAVELGKERLRTETAGIVSCHTVNLMNS